MRESKLSIRNNINLNWVVFFFIALLLIYSSTFIYPYLLLDELWMVREGSHTHVIAMGRPIFFILAWIAYLVADIDFLLSIYAMRLSGVIGLAYAAFYLARWINIWCQDKTTSIAIALTVMTLPAYQIVVADGTQLGLTIFLTVFSTYFCYQYREIKKGYIVAAILLFLALLIYQQQILVAFAMLGIPLLHKNKNNSVYRFVVSYGILVTAVSVFYFVFWRTVYKLIVPNEIDTRYGPDAVQVPSVEQLLDFFSNRLVQITNLWNVSNPPQMGLVVYVVLVLICIKVVYDFFKYSKKQATINYILLLCLLVTADGFVMLARAYPSYITATALTLLVFYWAFSGLGIFSCRLQRYGAIAIAIIGAITAFYTVKNELAYPNWADMKIVEEAILSNPEAMNFHIVGTKQGGPKYQEFGWRNSTTDGYLYLMIENVRDHLHNTNVLGREVTDMYFSIGNVSIWTDPEDVPHHRRFDEVIVKLNDS